MYNNLYLLFSSLTEDGPWRLDQDWHKKLTDAFQNVRNNDLMTFKQFFFLKQTII